RPVGLGADLGRRPAKLRGDPPVAANPAPRCTSWLGRAHPTRTKPSAARKLPAMEQWLEPLYDAEGMRAADRWAIEDQDVPSVELMEAAGAAVAAVAADVARNARAHVVCGKGNNGGDGLVAARELRRLGFEVDALLLWPGAELRGDAAANLERLADGWRAVGGREVGPALAGSGVVVDAIFGTGFAGAPRAPADAAIDAINGCGAPVVAADIPSGVDAATGEAGGADRHPARSARTGRRRPHRRRCARPRAAARGGLDQVHVRRGGGDRRLAGPHGRGLHVRRGRGSRGRRVRDRRRSRRSRGDLRDEAHRGHVAWIRWR